MGEICSPSLLHSCSKITFASAPLSNVNLDILPLTDTSKTGDEHTSTLLISQGDDLQEAHTKKTKDKIEKEQR